jgi:hypothetical protein
MRRANLSGVIWSSAVFGARILGAICHEIKKFGVTGMSVEIWILVVVGAATVLAGSGYLFFLRGRDHGDDEATPEQIDTAIVFYKRELLSTLEIVSGEAGNEDPRLFLNEIPRAIHILVHIDNLYRRKGVVFDVRGIHSLFCEAETIASDRKMWDAQGAKSVAASQIADVMGRIRSFVIFTMP